FKNIIAEKNSKTINCTDVTNNFLSIINLKPIFLKIFSLNGVRTDLLQISDQLIVTLNFVLFFIIRHQHNKKIVEFFNGTSFIFLQTVKSAIQYQKKQWNLYLHDSKYRSSTKANRNFLTLDFHHSLDLPVEQKKMIYNDAINMLLVMENILQRIYERLNETLCS
ncbi:uncharacterized protein LOC106637199, partial [Copidosoma floridanum]|uniref:uncharacterized protein LOC106637199 n=1 Tax=Copidosoma floridanum TaxID=29053 RepID=UPI0006C9E53A